MSNVVQQPNRVDAQGNFINIKGTLDTADSLFPQRNITAFPDTTGYPNCLLYGPIQGRDVGVDPNDPESMGGDMLVRRPIWYAPAMRGNPIFAWVTGYIYNPPLTDGGDPVDPTVVTTGTNPISPVVSASSYDYSCIDYGGGRVKALVLPSIPKRAPILETTWLIRWTSSRY